MVLWDRAIGLLVAIGSRSLVQLLQRVLQLRWLPMVGLWPLRCLQGVTQMPRWELRPPVIPLPRLDQWGGGRLPPPQWLMMATSWRSLVSSGGHPIRAPGDVSLDEAIGTARKALTQAQDVLHREIGSINDER
jgi:hypothetical protein